MIRLTNICKAYGGKPVLEHTDLSLPVGITFLDWPSGAGKTTLLRILLGLETPDEGRVEGTKGLRFGVVFQEDRLLEQLDARTNLQFALGKAYNEEKAQRLLLQLGLALNDPKRVKDYSGGMKRRLAFARSYLADSDALLLDEPFTGLDAENRAVMRALIEEYAKTKPVLLISHEEP
ncbi:MAG: ATP-binding cassette domain-containing protein [Firmicutes bacterium]|nr:ATP-binding cassette domain-containing protein [Bacillota bacterium]